VFITYLLNAVELICGRVLVRIFLLCTVSGKMAGMFGKRGSEVMLEVGNAVVSKKHKGHWSQGLFASIADPNLVIEEDDLTVVIKDKYPKV